MLNVTVGPDSPARAMSHGPVVTVPADATLTDAARAMRRANVSSVLIDGGPAILTERDLTIAIAEKLGPDMPASGVAGTDPVTVRDHTSVLQVAEVMLTRQVRHVILEDMRGEITAVVSMRDVVAVLLQAADPALSIFLHRMVTEHSEIWLG